MADNFDFSNLFIFDIANNHQGSVEHGLNIIKGIGAVTAQEDVRGAMKFQFRNLETFVHHDYKNSDLKHLKRFRETALRWTDYEILRDEARRNNLLTMCTPFDEQSVARIMEMDFDIIKIASCSANEICLLEEVSKTGKPVIVSTAGLHTSDIDRLVFFLEKRNTRFALMHCVALYPTDYDKTNSNRIKNLCKRYPELSIGFSTHEHPENYENIKLAVALGARLFERHVDIENPNFKMNAYSSNPEQIRKWIQAFKYAKAVIGPEERFPSLPKELDSLRSLKRGIFCKQSIKKGELIKRDDVFFAMPLLDNQLETERWTEGLHADQDYETNAPLSKSLASYEISDEDYINHVIIQVKGMLNEANIKIGKASEIELSHHYGLRHFREFGCVIITCVNREYCKKLIIQLPRQKHPYHYHKDKEETFQLLYGDVENFIDGTSYRLKRGDISLVEKGRWHKFQTLHGCIMEEISTTFIMNDSYYEDEKITMTPRGDRKTIINNWEREGESINGSPVNAKIAGHAVPLCT